MDEKLRENILAARKIRSALSFWEAFKRNNIFSDNTRAQVNTTILILEFVLAKTEADIALKSISRGEK